MKKIINEYQFQKRIGSHSLTGFAKGYSDFLPKTAEGYFCNENNLITQKTILLEELEQLNNKHKNRVRLTKEERNRKHSLNGMIGNINKALCLQSNSIKEELKAWLFWKICNYRLRHEIFKGLDMEADLILKKVLGK